MKKLQQTLIAFVMMVSSLVVSSAANAAAGTCQNGFTGPDSSNICTSVTTYECTVNNNNTFTLTNGNTQVSVSGDASTSGNGGGGSSQSGASQNINGVTYTVTVNNQDSEVKTCTATVTVPATLAPTPPAKQEVAPPKTVAPLVLANTSGDVTLGYIIAALIGLGSIAVIARVATIVYGRQKS